MQYHPMDYTTDSQCRRGPQSGWVLLVCLVSSLSSIYIVSLLVRCWHRNLRSQPPALGHRCTSIPNSNISIDKTQIILSKISHHRIFPVFHGFTYDYLSVGIPVRSPESNWLLSVNDWVGWWDRGWLHVFARDHLHRGREGSTLSVNLDGYLREEVSVILLHSCR